jgi:streptomycin 6-kinase
VLLHGDLTPVNVLDGGAERGLVAIDPAPCLGDAAFDAVDLLLWQTATTTEIEARAEQLAPLLRVERRRLLGWCTAFAGMVALELAEARTGSREQIAALASLASRA